MYDLIPQHLHGVHPVGRLDKDTTGALLLTNDGECTLRLTHPRYEVEKLYDVTVNGIMTDEVIRKITHGIPLEDGRTAPARVKVKKRKDNKTRLFLTIKEGKKRQIRRMFEALGHTVRKLKRTAIGPIRIGALPAGSFRHLTETEGKKIKDRPIRTLRG